MSIFITYFSNIYCRESPHGAMAKDYGLKVSEFDIQSCHYVHFPTNTVGKCMNPLISLTDVLNSNVLQQRLV